MGFPGGSVVKNLPANAEVTVDSSSISGWGSSPGGGNGSPLQYSCLENPVDRGSWRATAHGVAKLHTTEQELECQHLWTFAFGTFTMQNCNGIPESPCPPMDCNLFKVRNTVLPLSQPQKLALDWYEAVCHLWMLTWCLDLTSEQADLSLLQAY